MPLTLTPEWRAFVNTEEWQRIAAECKEGMENAVLGLVNCKRDDDRFVENQTTYKLNAIFLSLPEELSKMDMAAKERNVIENGR